VSISGDADTKARWFEEHWKKHVPFNNEIGLEIYEWTPGLVRARVPYQDKLSAHDGILHGGVIATALDAVGGGAVVAGHDFTLGSRFTTVSMTVQFMAVGSGVITIEGVCLKRGRRLNFARATALSSEGALIAEAMLTISASGERARVGQAEGSAGHS
jgi:uncharacterized protein (TIGR00369 family)